MDCAYTVYSAFLVLRPLYLIHPFTHIRTLFIHIHTLIVQPSGAVWHLVSCPRQTCRLEEPGIEPIDHLISWRYALPPKPQPPHVHLLLATFLPAGTPGFRRTWHWPGIIPVYVYSRLTMKKKSYNKIAAQFKSWQNCCIQTIKRMETNLRINYWLNGNTTPKT